MVLLIQTVLTSVINFKNVVALTKSDAGRSPGDQGCDILATDVSGGEWLLAKCETYDAANFVIDRICGSFAMKNPNDAGVFIRQSDIANFKTAYSNRKEK